MAYVPTEWTIGDLITPDKLNKMERGIANAAEGDFGDIDAVLDAINGNKVWVPGLPTVSQEDNGKFLRVTNGVWSAVSVPAAEGVAF